MPKSKIMRQLHSKALGDLPGGSRVDRLLASVGFKCRFLSDIPSGLFNCNLPKTSEIQLLVRACAYAQVL